MPQIINNWPYSDIHNINLDWILAQVKELGHKVENMETFFPHISTWNNGEWDIDHNYELNEIVINGNDIYLAKKNVPAGENINNTDYWLLVGTDSYIMNKVDKSGDTMTGQLNVPNINVYNATYPQIKFSKTANSNEDGMIYFDEDNSIRRFVFRQDPTTGSTYQEVYALPQTIGALTETKIYGILTSKETGAQIFTNGEPTAVASGILENVATITLPAGIWIVQFVAVFENNATGYREIGLGAGALDPYMNRYCKMAEQAANGIDTELSVTTVLVPTVETTYYLNVMQNSGASLNVTGGLDARRLV